MRIARLILGVCLAGCGSVSVAALPGDGGVMAGDAGANEAGDAGANEAATGDAGANEAGDAGANEAGDAGQATLACPNSIGSFCCAPGGIDCWANWYSAARCSLSFEMEIVPDCDGFHAYRNFVTPTIGGYWLYAVSTGDFVARLGCGGQGCADFGCADGPPILDIDAGCLSYWANLPTQDIPCLDAGDTSPELFACDGAAPPDDGAVASDASFMPDVYPGD
jgi:hypothetical protein